MNWKKVSRRRFLAGSGGIAALALGQAAFARPGNDQFTLIVMDPLAAPLSCDCVKGYAQRDYEKLGKYLEPLIGRPVKVYFAKTLQDTLTKKTGGKADLIIGKESVIRHEAQEAKIKAVPIASLTGKDGSTTMTGWVVVPASDPAVSPTDLTEHQVLFGPADCDEKHKAALALWKELGLAVPSKPATCPSCSDGATKILDMAKKGKKAATVISSYAGPLLEGCGTIQKGDLKVIGKTEPVPFIVAFANDSLTSDLKEALVGHLTAIRKKSDLLEALETKDGFVAISALKKS